MTNLISGTIAKISSLVNRLQVKQFLCMTLVGFLILTSHVDLASSNQAASKKLDQIVHQDDLQRPKTTAEWKQQARETKGDPGERLKRIGEQSTEAIKDFGSVYPDVAKRSATELRNNNETSK
ncbi:hypothetical protein [Merismopedia glauca]|uniref:Uncharacterized protein n=1 Tax=Merismopedia glauca CCAP 1448/3 TaxID=1296344 RepID=A0A2T1C0T6_9CYAN|nr:hypothetical protein [Merismopedia glauca]PSB01886.1 hypothetical protein C7B64_16035 [Merismopedia glauca CCAP 1448/3]